MATCVGETIKGLLMWSSGVTAVAAGAESDVRPPSPLKENSSIVPLSPVAVIMNERLERKAKSHVPAGNSDATHFCKHQKVSVV